MHKANIVKIKFCEVYISQKNKVRLGKGQFKVRWSGEGKMKVRR